MRGRNSNIDFVESHGFLRQCHFKYHRRWRTITKIRQVAHRLYLDLPTQAEMFILRDKLKNKQKNIFNKTLIFQLVFHFL
jgi:hypothetical protein